MQIPPLPGPWDDPNVHRPYNAASLAEKVYNKLQLQEDLGLPLSDTVAVVGSDGPVPDTAQAVALADAHAPADWSRILSGCDMLVTQDEALQALARQYGTLPVADDYELDDALMLYRDEERWFALLKDLMR
jgi:hypothetical protein